MLEILRPGPLTTIQDRGRPGYAHLGVPRSGALDQPAYALANRLVGNPVGAAALELTLGGLVCRPCVSTVVALTGAPAPCTVDGRPIALGAPTWVKAGATLVVGLPEVGVRSYLAVAGGISVPAVLGSRSADTLSGLGPQALVGGEVLPLGEAGEGAAVDSSFAGAWGGELVLRVRWGPRAEWFADRERLTGAGYTIGMGNRVGARLAGPSLTRAQAGELPSEGLVAGAIQVPGDGRPLIFLADHPTTGGYPVIAVVHPDDLPRVAQARPGSACRFIG